MKMAVLYYSRSGYTVKMAERIKVGMESVDGVEAKIMSIDNPDKEYIKDSSCVVVGTPTYYASMAAEVKTWLDKESGKYSLAGKLGGAFATGGYAQGGSCIAIQNILTHLTFMGMLVYSGGGSFGEPPIHLGPVGISGTDTDYGSVFEIYGQRMAQKAKELF